MRPRRSTRLRAFTLVELLVVIGIIAVMIGILLPALNKARQSANNLKCMANLRSIGQAINIYAAQSKGVLPYGYWNGSNPLGGPAVAAKTVMRVRYLETLGVVAMRGAMGTPPCERLGTLSRNNLRSYKSRTPWDHKIAT